MMAGEVATAATTAQTNVLFVKNDSAHGGGSPPIAAVLVLAR